MPQKSDLALTLKVYLKNCQTLLRMPRDLSEFQNSIEDKQGDHDMVEIVIHSVPFYISLKHESNNTNHTAR